VAIKMALAGWPPLALAAARFLLGGVVVFAGARATGVRLRLQAGELSKLARLVVLFIAQIFTLNVGTSFTTGGRSTLFISTYPFFTALFAHLFIPGDRLNRLKVLGMILSFSGVVLVLAESFVLQDLAFLVGDLTVLLSGLLLGARQVYTKRLTQGIPPMKLLLWQDIISLPVFMLLSGLFERPAHLSLAPDIVGAILYQGLVIAGFCFIAYTTLLRTYSASRLGVFGFITPVIGVMLGNLLLGEGLSSGLVASMLLVGAGIAIVNREAG
jgi:drug/metabolite transporter (DMT)-like permease